MDESKGPGLVPLFRHCIAELAGRGVSPPVAPTPIFFFVVMCLPQCLRLCSVALTGPATNRQGACAVPSEDYSHGPPCLAGLFVKGDRPNRAALKLQKYNMTTNSKNIHSQGTLIHPEHAVANPDLINQVINGDCQEVLRQLPSASVDMVLTDPPYLVRYQDKAGRRIINDDNNRWMFPAFAELYRVMKPDSYCVSFYGWGRADRFLNVWRECGFHPVGHFVWVKQYASTVRHVQMKHESAYLLAKGFPKLPANPPPDVLPWKYTGNRLHPTQKPVASLTPLIEAFCPVGGIVLDPFGGSGSTGIAARMLKRRFILIEKDAGYYAAAHNRLTARPPARVM